MIMMLGMMMIKIQIYEVDDEKWRREKKKKKTINNFYLFYFIE